MRIQIFFFSKNPLSSEQICTDRSIRNRFPVGQFLHRSARRCGIIRNGKVHWAFFGTPKIDFDTIMAWLEKMGNDLGAHRIFFRDEEGANALPPRKGILERYTPAFVEFAQLRLYCVRVSDQIVILLNGGIKTSEKVQDSPDCIAHFRLAVQFCKLLDEQIREGSIKIREKDLEMDDPGFYL